MSTESAADRVDSGFLSQTEVLESGYRELPVSVEAPPIMAVRAGRAVVDGSGVDPSQITLNTHAWIYHQGHDFWAPAHHVASELGLLNAMPVGISQMCNGAGIALELAVDHLRSPTRGDTVLMTTADRFCEPGFDRWHGDYGLWYGDGATAALLRSTPADGDLHLLSVATDADSSAEKMHRGDDEFTDSPMAISSVIDIRRTKRAYLARHGKDAFAATVADRIPALLTTAFTAAGLSPNDPQLASVVLPRLGSKALTAAYRPAVAQVTRAPVRDVGAATGHLGAGDLIANMALLEDDSLCPPGQMAVVLSAGGGFSWTAAVIRKPSPTTTDKRKS
ncbi:hypothetical protein [Williamsia sp.]|uniref:hypothetical protein n=1 Tax=Williamsia sp. TaxID=1872085 RepID=UPI001A2C1979|nr:hypothetical protein [Williamsia sp.]MBJ7289693.1 hypothetical protein [Williamsia sp.]